MWTLMRCAINYDPATGWRFSTYAYRSLMLAAHQIAKRQLAAEPRGGSRLLRTTRSIVPASLAAAGADR
jgi:hypothetical protein